MNLLHVVHGKSRVELSLNFWRLHECHSSELRNTETHFIKLKFLSVGVYYFVKSVLCLHIIQC
jgi:hypothetical protein